ncbi:HNH endonuclease signature motif containing protein [Microbispora sp. H13382]|uniref:HNH endonuclease signature motif containing protein n=1 Tax=Microbispora sp. H13382 TaxID=2729112 RepID=UPI0016003FC5|nr:HNH endonuclease signature motif containing protein [Microbispora sp. H13382]
MDLFDCDPDRPRRSNNADGGWWDRLTADSPLWSTEGSLARDGNVENDAAADTGSMGSEAADGCAASAGPDGAGSAADDAGAGSAGANAAGAGDRRGRSSWVLIGSLRETAQALALAPLPDDVDVCLAEAEELVFARDRITCALADRVGRVHRAGQAKRHGHASTRSWLRTTGGMSVAGAGRLLTLGIELARLPKVREKFAAGDLAAGVVEAICAAISGLSDEHAAVAEPILLELAGKAGAAEVARAGRYLRAVLDPDGEDRDERADYGRRFLRVRRGKGGGLEGEFYLPREHAARLQALLDAYARPKAEGDDRPLRVRQADAFMALLEEKIAAELLVLVNAESLPTDPATDCPESADRPESADHPETFETPEDTEEPENTQDAEAAEEAASAVGAGADVAREAAVENAGQSAVESAELTTGPHDVEPGDHATGRAQAKGRQRSESPQEPQQSSSPQRRESERSAPRRQEWHSWESRWGEWRSPDPLGDTCVHHAHAGPRPAGEDRHGQATREDDGHEHQRHGEGACGCGCGSRARCSSTAPETPRTPGASDAREAEPGTPQGVLGPEPEASSGGEPGSPQDVLGPEPEKPPGPEPERPPGGEPGASPGASAGGLPGALLGALGTLGTAPGLLLATGQVLPVSSVHRLARTSTLVRLVMDAEGQVLDMGRKVRLATPAQRRAIYARYATCWIDGCPLPATRCQIDHADNWSTGGLTDLKLLGPACQFHNRDRYQHPDRYTRRKTGKDRWAFTYHPARTSRVRI